MASTDEKSTNGKPKAKAKPDKKPKCGIVMPISDMDGYPSGHWNDVLTILETVVKDADFEVDLVSNADEVTVIHQTIVQNLYENDIVICDVSGKNPNVMFELGMRLAFDKPTIIIIDDRTDFSFDTGVISHVLYPSDLRFPKMVDFQKTLKNKILATHKKATEDKSYSPFLKHFGRYQISELETKSISSEDYILKSLETLTGEIASLKKGFVQKKTTVNTAVEIWDMSFFLLSNESSDSVNLKNMLLGDVLAQYIKNVTVRDGGLLPRFNIYFYSPLSPEGVENILKKIGDWGYNVARIES